MEEQDTYSMGEGDEGGSDVGIATNVPLPKKGLKEKWKAVPLWRKGLIVLIGAGIVFLPVEMVWKNIQAKKSEQNLLAMQKRAKMLQEAAARRQAQTHIVQNGFSSIPSPQGGQGFPSSPGSPYGQAGFPSPAGSGCLSRHDLDEMEQKVSRIEKIVETSTVTQAVMQKNLTSLPSDLSDVKNALISLNKREISIDGKVGKFCAASAGMIRRDPSSPMQDYTSNGMPIQEAAVPLFSGWRVLGASGEGAVLIDSQGVTHLVNKGASIGKVRVVSIDSDTGYVAFSNGELVKP